MCVYIGGVYGGCVCVYIGGVYVGYVCVYIGGGVWCMCVYRRGCMVYVCI